MTKKKDKKEYQKPELVHIDDPAFDETGKGSSGFTGPIGGGHGGGGHSGGGYGGGGSGSGGGGGGHGRGGR